MARVSVIIPTNRLNPWLYDAVMSVLQQLSQDDELVLVLDGIDFDDVPEWTKDPRVRITRTITSRGVGVALRHGVSTSTGEFVARLDSDDLALPGRFEAQVDYLRRNPDTVALATETIKFTDHGGRVGQFPFKPGEDVRHSLLLQNVIVQSSVMFRRENYEQVGGYPEFRQMEDYVLWLRLGTTGKVAILNGEYTSYRLHDSQLSKKTDPVDEYVDAALEARNALAAHLEVSGLKQKFYNALWRTAHYLHSRHGERWGRIKTLMESAVRSNKPQ